MELKRLALPGALTAGVAVFAALGLALSSSDQPRQTDTDPAGQVVKVNEPAPEPPAAEPTATGEARPGVEDAPVAQPAPAENGDTGPMNQPTPADQIPEVAPGNPVGDVQERPTAGPPPEPAPAPVDEPTELNPGPPPPADQVPSDN